MTKALPLRPTLLADILPATVGTRGLRPARACRCAGPEPAISRNGQTPVRVVEVLDEVVYAQTFTTGAAGRGYECAR